MPSRAPTNVTVSNLQPGEVKVEWEPIPPQTANGRLLGYRVYYRYFEYRYPSYYWQENTVNTSSPHVHMLVLRNLKQARPYVIAVAAFTSKGPGPRSSFAYVLTGTECIANIHTRFQKMQLDIYT